MSIPILVEPAANGYRAEAGSPLDLSAEADTAAGAVAALRAKIADRLRDSRQSDRERQALEGEVESLERRIDEAVFKLNCVNGLPLAEEPTPSAPVATTGDEVGRSGGNGDLPPDISEALARVEHLDAKELRQAVIPEISRQQSDRLADLNRKAQDDGLSKAEEVERDELLHLYEKSIVVRAKALAELRRRGVDISDLIAP
jgi:hypothetical protein